MEGKNINPGQKPIPKESRDIFGEIFSFRNVLICAIILGTIIVIANILN